MCFSRGQLGHGDLESVQEFARQVDSLAGLHVTSVAAGNWHSAAVTECGDLYTWGWNQSGQLGFCTGEVTVLLVINRTHAEVNFDSVVFSLLCYRTESKLIWIKQQAPRS